ncbi:MAG TPA: ADP-ribosylation factor-like protein [Planctomycetota bacterium]|nr:ADP-ribosylation factor-like protein [Planctomycetota bacterium]
MVQINFARREVNCKIVYYGPGLSGKTTNLELIHQKAGQGIAGQLTSIATEQDRTLFFDFMPLDIGSVAGMKTKFFLYTVPGQVYYNSTRKLVLQGADGVVFVADSDPNRMSDNLDSLKNLEENLKDYNLDPKKIPFVIQYNKRDLPAAMPVAELDNKLNRWKIPTYEAVAVKGEGVMQTLKGLSKMIIERLNDDYGKQPAGATAVPAPPPAAKPATAKPAAPAPAPRPAPAPVAAASKPSAPAPRPAPVPAARAQSTPSAKPSPMAGRSTHGSAKPAPATARPAPATSKKPARGGGGGGGAGKWVAIILILLVVGAAAAYFVLRMK